MNFEAIYIKEEEESCKETDIEREAKYQFNDFDAGRDYCHITKELSCSRCSDITEGNHEDVDIKKEMDHVNIDNKEEELSHIQYNSSDIDINSVNKKYSFHDFIPLRNGNYFRSKMKENISKNYVIPYDVANQCASGSVSLNLFECQSDLYQNHQNSIENRNLVQLLQTHKSEKKFKCSDCDYSTIRKADLEMHIRRHRGEKPFKCNLCDYRASQKSTLYRHIKSHTGKRPFKCNDCDYSALEKSHLRRHIKCHTGEKPFECNICNYSTSEKSKLKRHIRTHTGEKPFKCCDCDYSTSYRNSLLKHIVCHTV